MSDGKKLDLTATVKRVGYRSFTSWGDPSHNDDWETPAIVLSIELSPEDKKNGFSLEELTIWLESYETNLGTKPGIEGTMLEGINEGTMIKIYGPLYRADMGYGWSENPLTEEFKEVEAVPGPIWVSSHTEAFPFSNIRKLPMLSIKTARKANACLRECPIAKA